MVLNKDLMKGCGHDGFFISVNEVNRLMNLARLDEIKIQLETEIKDLILLQKIVEVGSTPNSTSAMSSYIVDLKERLIEITNDNAKAIGD